MYIKSFCYMCSPVEHYVCFYLIFFLYEIEDVPLEKNSFGVKTIIGVPGKVVHLYYNSVYCACLSVVFVAFRLKLSQMAALLGKSKYSSEQFHLHSFSIF